MREFELVGGHAALDLVNTLDWRFRTGGQEELLTGYVDLVSFALQSRLLTPRQARRLMRAARGPASDRVLADARALRESLSDTIYASIDQRAPAHSSLPLLEKFFQAWSAATRLSREAGGLKWEWGPAAEESLDFPLWVLARAASQLMLSRHANQIRACGNPECRWLFLDTSKNHTRRWCDMKICGNRMKARRFRASHSSD